ncbi:hypothetical protein BB560_002927 [Smittium megazygosporum]|uniref:Arrestin-like N-terminal domain-containing protein n=1 Tax=Smittium megazygosporum TaxID=133381 RepID=A0A2T9ZDG1_9FUNG|nr:hypothetical protein BB560_002927 [Smittium megazygosporum]
MSTVTHFEVCFPTHGNKVPIFRPGASISGTVVLKLDSPLAASYIELNFTGTETIFRSHDSNEDAANSNVIMRGIDKASTPGENVELVKEFFSKDVLLWGNYLSTKHAALLNRRKAAAKASGFSINKSVDEKSKIQIIDSGTAHTYHFNVTMPKVNMPISKKTDKYQIQYTLKATIYSQSKKDGDTSAVKAICTTPTREFSFEPLISEVVEIRRGSLPFRNTIFLKDSALLASGGKSGTKSLKKFIKGSEKNSSDKQTELILFQPYPAFIPGELVDIIILIPGSKSIKGCTYDFLEIVKCKKSSAPTIDDSDVPLLWTIRNKIISNSELHFHKLSRPSVSSDLGLMGRFMFTNLSSSESSKLSSTIVKTSIVASPRESMAPSHSPTTRKPNSPSSNSVSRQSTPGWDGNKSKKNSIIKSLPYNTTNPLQSLQGQASFGKGMGKHSFHRNKIPIVPVPLGNLLSTENYKFARVKFNLPTSLEMCSVPSVFLDFEYAIELHLNLGSSFGGMRKMIGTIPLRIITKRIETGGGSTGNTVKTFNPNGSIISNNTSSPSNLNPQSAQMAYHGSSKHYENDIIKGMKGVNVDQIRDHHYSHISSTANPMPGVESNIDFHTKPSQDPTLVDTSSKHIFLNEDNENEDNESEEQSFPNLQYYIQYGEKIPTPEIELVKIR